jgi:iron complex transport system permease protein
MMTASYATLARQPHHPSNKRSHLVSKTALTFMSLLAATTAVFWLSLLLGSVHLSAHQVWQGFTGASPLAHTLIFELRLPRVLAAFAVGGLLALAGVLMQVLLRNPLADPFIMGVSGGASVAALLAILLGAGTVVIGAAASVGAFAATVLVFGLAYSSDGWTATRLLLTGVVIASGTSAIVSLLLTLGEDTRLRGMLFWLMGDLSFAGSPCSLLLLLALATVIGLLSARHLNVLARGELQALSVGVPVSVLRAGIFLSSSVLTAATVTAAGTIGFVGLVTPHIARLLVGSDHRRVMPAAVLMGACTVATADLLARTLLSPRQLPVGALTALVGVPLFLLLMRNRSS